MIARNKLSFTVRRSYYTHLTASPIYGRRILAYVSGGIVGVKTKFEWRRSENEGRSHEGNEEEMRRKKFGGGFTFAR